MHRPWRNHSGDKCTSPQHLRFPLLFSMEGSKASWEMWGSAGFLLCSTMVVEQALFSWSTQTHLHQEQIAECRAAPRADTDKASLDKDRGMLGQCIWGASGVAWSTPRQFHSGSSSFLKIIPELWKPGCKRDLMSCLLQDYTVLLNFTEPSLYMSNGFILLMTWSCCGN